MIVWNWLNPKKIPIEYTCGGDSAWPENFFIFSGPYNERFAADSSNGLIAIKTSEAYV